MQQHISIVYNPGKEVIYDCFGVCDCFEYSNFFYLFIFSLFDEYCFQLIFIIILFKLIVLNRQLKLVFHHLNLQHFQLICLIYDRFDTSMNFFCFIYIFS